MCSHFTLDLGLKPELETPVPGVEVGRMFEDVDGPLHQVTSSQT